MINEMQLSDIQLEATALGQVGQVKLEAEKIAQGKADILCSESAVKQGKADVLSSKSAVEQDKADIFSSESALGQLLGWLGQVRTRIEYFLNNRVYILF